MISHDCLVHQLEDPDRLIAAQAPSDTNTGQIAAAAAKVLTE
jgi:hypothetical protein